MTRKALLRYRAERLLRGDFSTLRRRVLAIVRSRLRMSAVALDDADLDACYAQAWQGLYCKLVEGEQIEDISAWLVLVTFRRAIDEARARARQRAACEAQAALAELRERSSDGHARDVAAQLDDRARLREVLEALSGRLSARERRAASLCYLQGLSRAEAARRMGLSEARMRKLMDGSAGRPGVAGKMSELLRLIGAGEWCKQQGSLMRAYAFGVLDPEGERHRLAAVHLRECPACRAFVLSLRGLAALFPPLPLPAGSLGAGPARGTRPGPARGARPAGVHAPAGLPLKLVALGAFALSAGGGYALLAGGAPGHGAPPGGGSPALAVHRPNASIPVYAPNPNGGLQSRAHRPSAQWARAAVRFARSAPARSGGAARVTHPSPAHPSSAHPPLAARAPLAASASPGAKAPLGTRPPLGEFTPERTSAH